MHTLTEKDTRSVFLCSRPKERDVVAYLERTLRRNAARSKQALVNGLKLEEGAVAQRQEVLRVNISDSAKPYRKVYDSLEPRHPV